MILFIYIFLISFLSCSSGLGLSTKVTTPPGSIITTCQHQNTSCQPTSGEENEESRRHSKNRVECALFERTRHHEAVRKEEVVHNTPRVTEVLPISSRRSARFTMTTVVLIVDSGLSPMIQPEKTKTTGLRGNKNKEIPRCNVA